MASPFSLNGSVAAIQYELQRAASIPHSTAFVPFPLHSLLDSSALAAFRLRVDDTASAIMGPAWAEYCSQVQRMVAEEEQSAV